MHAPVVHLPGSVPSERISSSLRGTTPGTRRRAAAYTLLEAVVVFALVGVIAGVAITMLNGRSDPTADMAARASLVQASSLQAAQADAPLADIGVLAELDPSRVWTASASTSSSTVSVAIDPDDSAVLGVAVAAGEGCWMLRRDYDNPTRGGAQIWAVAESGSCSAARALQLEADPTGVRGASVDTPLIL